MGGANVFSESVLKACVQRLAPEVDGAIALRPVATGKFNSSYYAQCGDADYVLRVAPADDAGFIFYEKNMMRQEPEIHGLLLERTSVPAPRIVGFDDSREILDRDFLLMERLPGLTLAEATEVDTGRVMEQVGRALAEAHSIRAEQYGYLGAHRPMEPASNWRDAFATMWRLLIEGVVACGHYNEDESALLLGLFDEFASVFDYSEAACLLHMDVWAQNILVDAKGDLSGLVDWDRAVWGDPEIEFAVLDYCGVSTPDFWKGYGAPRNTSEEGRIRQVFYYLYELQKYIIIRQARQNNTAGALQYKRHVFDTLRQAFAIR